MTSVKLDMHLLALSGSLRALSINTELLRAFALRAPAGTQVTVYAGLATLPPYNPDLDEEGMSLPAAVTSLRAQIAAADALVICCPEYAHGVAGSFKNLLDWLVSGSEVPGKPVCVVSASSGSLFGPPSLVETLSTMSATVVTGSAVTIPVNGRRLNAVGIVADVALASAIDEAIRAIAETVTTSQASRLRKS